MKNLSILLITLCAKISLQTCDDRTCLECRNGVQCQVPIPGRYINSQGISLLCYFKQCTQCEQIDGHPVCSECISGWVPDPANVYQCIKCENTKCRTCDKLNLTKCTSCNDGYRLVNDEDCSKCLNSQCYNCNFADSKCSSCSGQVVDRYSYEASTCLKCKNVHCLQCPKGLHVCQKCDMGFGVKKQSPTQKAQICVNCEENNCKSCSLNSTICQQCKNGYVLSEEGICIQCPQKCQKCVIEENSVGQKSISCVYCFEGFGLNQEGLCVDCGIHNCALCDPDVSVCQICKSGYGLTESGTCEKCHQRCKCKQTNVTYCSRCTQGDHFVVINKGYCPKDCYWNHCAECSSYFICKYCEPLFGIKFDSQNFYQCKERNDLNCLNCSTNYNHCLQCSSGYGLNESKCSQCQQGCLDCQLNVSQCVKCDEQSLFQLHKLQCIHCEVSNCISCLTINDHCSICQDRYFNKSDGSCEQCPLGCPKCQFDLLNGKTVCTECAQYYEPKEQQCREICGDLIAVNFQCDKQIGIEFNGCDDQCKTETGFNCTKTQQSKSFILTVNVQPPLHIFKLMSKQQILRTFSFENEQFQLINAKYDSSHRQFTFNIKIVSEVVSNALQLKFKPKQQILNQFFQTPSVILVINYNFTHPFYYSQIIILFTKIVKYLSFFVICFVWISVIAGIIMKNTFGLQAMFVVQFFFLTFLWMNTRFFSTYYSVLPLKYSFGYNYEHLIQQNNEKVTEIAPFTSQFQMSDSFLANNFSFLLVLLSVAAILLLISYINYKVQKMEKHKDNKLSWKEETRSNRKTLMNSKEQKENEFSGSKEKEETWEENSQNSQKSQQKFNFCLNILFHFASVSIIPFVCLVVVLCAQNKITHFSNISLSLFALGGITFVFSMFYFFPYRFVCLMLFYKKTFAAQNTLNLYFCVIVSMSIVFCVFPSLPFLLLIFLVPMMVFSAIVRPHCESVNNYRFLFNCSVMCVFVGLKCQMKYFSNPFHTDFSTMLFILIATFLCFFCVLISFVFHVLHRFEKNKQKSLKEKSKNFSEEEKIYLEVLNKLVKTDVGKKVGCLEHNFFKDIISPKISIRQFSKQLQQKLKSDLEKGNSPHLKTEKQWAKYKPFDSDDLDWNKVGHKTLGQKFKENEKIFLKDEKEKKIRITEMCIQNELTFLDFEACKDRTLLSTAFEERFLREYNNLENEDKNESAL